MRLLNNFEDEMAIPLEQFFSNIEIRIIPLIFIVIRRHEQQKQMLADIGIQIGRPMDEIENLEVTNQLVLARHFSQVGQQEIETQIFVVIQLPDVVIQHQVLAEEVSL